jgi:hypothetical protein
MAKHAKPKQTLRNATLTRRGENVVYTAGMILFFTLVALLNGLLG